MVIAIAIFEVVQTATFLFTVCENIFAHILKISPDKY